MGTLGGTGAPVIPDFTGASGATFAGESFGDIGGAAGNVPGIGTAAQPTALGGGRGGLFDVLFRDTSAASSAPGMTKLRQRLLFMQLLGGGF